MKRTTLFWTVLFGACLGLIGCGGSSSPVFTETWAAGAGAWRTTDGNPINIATEADCPAYQHETIQSSGGRVITRAAVAVEAGQPYCMTAWVRAAGGGVPFLGLQLAAADGTPDGLEHWPIGLAGYTSGSPVATTVPVSLDGSWAWYAAPFTMDDGARAVVLKDENFAAGGAADYAAIQLFAGECPAAPATTCAAAE